MHSIQTLLELRRILSISAHQLLPAGSQYTCNPPPPIEGSDEDWLVHVWSDPTEALLAHGFTQLGQPEFYTGNDNGGFKSWRRGHINLIITPEAEFFDRFKTATYLAKRYNLLEKQDRIALFQVILYGVDVNSLESEPYDPAKAEVSEAV